MYLCTITMQKKLKSQKLKLKRTFYYYYYCNSDMTPNKGGDRINLLGSKDLGFMYLEL